MAGKISVLIVDDSATVRSILQRRLTQDPEIEVVGYARDGLEALESIRALKPSVVTLDVEMPRMDGLKTIRHIMRDLPTPTIMVSSLTSAGADVTIQALELGAVDFILKPTRGGLPAVHEVTDELCAKVKLAARANIGARSATGAPGALSGPERPGAAGSRWLDKVVVIGSSTGGPQALCKLLSSLPHDTSVPVLVVQHMPEGFTRSLAARLDGLSPLRVAEARSGVRLAPGQAWVAPGGLHMVIDGQGEIRLNHGPTECGVRPSINVTMESVVSRYGSATLGVVLTGMGSDGTRGAQLIKAAGGEVIAEDESTCIVYGMPRSAAEAGCADEVLPLPSIAAGIVRRCRAPTLRQEMAS